MSSPRFEHDCEGCVYLGQDEEHDFYFCPKAESDMGGSIVARYSSEGSNYSSSPVSIIRRILQDGWADVQGKHVPGSDPAVQQYPLAKGLKLAEDQGLVQNHFSIVVGSTGGAADLVVDDLLLPKRVMSEEERALLRAFLLKRLDAQFKGYLLTQYTTASMQHALQLWLLEWEHVRA